ncbi:universal stress protein [Microbacterium sp. 2FI]|uniref:universal stress protein n=1 Tax=Microbacterium sp. 2FI TaxID=2502193 RepID=UPI0010F72476|nr:universal stress protein [Microbacterium sp. 2FI]
MERIALGFDGSPAAGAALRWTAARAARGAASVDVVLVESRYAKDHELSEAHLGDAEAFLRDRLPGLDVTLHRVDGDVPGAIARTAEDADLVVVGINPGHPIRAAAMGWTPLRLSTRATAPVYLIPLDWTPGDDPVTVGVADDDSSDPALDAGTAEAATTTTRLRLVHSWLMPMPTFDYGTALALDPDVVAEEHRRVLDVAAQRVRQQHPDLPLQTELIRDSRSGALLRFASRSSLLVIGTHRRSVLAGALLGSVAQEVLWRADCPVCVVPPRRPARAN